MQRFGLTWVLMGACSSLIALVGCQQIPEDSLVSDGGGDGDGDPTDGDENADTGLPPGGSEPQYLCDPSATVACPPGEKCTPLSLDGSPQNIYDCVPADDEDLERFDLCVPSPGTGLDGCAPGLVCLPFDDEDPDNGVCMELCLTEVDCDEAGCIDHVHTDVPVCSDYCNPLTSLCHETQKCLRNEHERFACQVPHPLDVGVQNDPCDGINDFGCAEGFGCLTGDILPGCESMACCSALCDLEAPDSPCQSPATCNPLYLDDSPPGLETLGACYVPA